MDLTRDEYGRKYDELDRWIAAYKDRLAKAYKQLGRGTEVSDYAHDDLPEPESVNPKTSD